MSNKNTLIKTLILLSAIFLFGIIYLSPYIINNYSFVIGFDSGVYLYKSKTLNLNFWDDPLFYHFFSTLQQISGLENIYLYKLLPIFFIISLAPTIYLISKTLNKNNSSALLVVCLTLLSILLLKSFYYSFTRQIFATILLTYLLYFLMRYDLRNKSLWIISSILFATILLAHKGMALFALILIVIKSVYSIDNDETKIKNKLINLSKILLLSFILVSIYLIPFIQEYIETLFESFKLSFEGLISKGQVRSIGGRSLISDSEEGTNQIFDLIKFNPFLYLTSFIILLIYLVRIKRLQHQKKIFLLFLAFIFLWILAKFNFSSRLVFNLSILLILILPLFFNKLSKKFKIITFFIILTLTIISLTSFAQTNKPYIIQDTESMDFIRENISPNDSLIISSDYLQTIFAQEGYLVSQYHYPLDFDLNTGEHIDKLSMVNSDNFLIQGYENLSFLKDYNLDSKYQIYVVLGSWEVFSANLPRATISGKIDLEKWDESQKWETLHHGKNEIIRVYKLKNATNTT